jgi:cell wall assembly regulator SMI1
MKTIWDRIHVWLAAKAPEVAAGLRPGAGVRQIRAAEKAMDVVLPDDVREAYRIHDGEGPDGTAPSPGLLYGWRWMPLKEVAGHWRLMKELLDQGTFAGVSSDPRGPIRSDWWHPKWVPLAEGGGGGLRCVDLAPRSRGKVGQVIGWWNDCGAGAVLAKSFAGWLAGFADELEDGEWGVHSDYPGLVSLDDLGPDEEFDQP